MTNCRKLTARVGAFLALVLAAALSLMTGSLSAADGASELAPAELDRPKVPAHPRLFAIAIAARDPSTGVEWVTDGWRGVSPKTTLSLTSEWREHVIEFEIKNPFKDETRLRFTLPQEAAGTFELTDFHLRESDDASPGPK